MYSILARFAATGDTHTTNAKRLLCGWARHFVHRKFHINIGVVTRPGARICPGGPEHLPGLTRILSNFYLNIT